MSARSVVLDAGVLHLAEADREFRHVLHGLVEAGYDVAVPAVVLAEAATGRPTDAPINRFINRVGTVATPEAMARRAGTLRHAVQRTSSQRLPSGIDAIVAAHAAGADVAVVFTTDTTDLRRLLVEFPHIAVERP